MDKNKERLGWQMILLIEKHSRPSEPADSGLPADDVFLNNKTTVCSRAMQNLQLADKACSRSDKRQTKRKARQYRDDIDFVVGSAKAEARAHSWLFLPNAACSNYCIAISEQRTAVRWLEHGFL